MRRFALCLLLVLACAGAAAEDVSFYGYAYDLRNGRYLYTEVHHQHLDGDHWLGGTIRYYDPDGSLIGDKTLDFSQDPYIPLYRLELPREHYAEAITAITPDHVVLQKTRDGKTRTERIERVPGMAADSGFNSLLLAHFSELEDGKLLRFRFAVAGNLDSYRFRARKIADLKYAGEPAIQLRVEPDSLLSMLVDPLLITYSTVSRHLLEYRGISNIHDPDTGSAYNVRIVYPPTPPPDAPKSLPPL